jgi:AcrR family transcriptional regulator
MDGAWRKATKQVRSEASAQRIVGVAMRLLATTRFEDLTIAQVARTANISIGGLYARFADKEALVHAVDEQLMEEFTSLLRQRLDPARLRGKTLPEVVRTYVSLMLAQFRARRGILRQVVIRARASNDARFVARLRAFNREAHARLTAALCAFGGIRHRDPAQAVAFAAMFVSAAAREAVLFGDRRLNLARPSGRKLLDELCRAFTAYLTLGNET